MGSRTGRRVRKIQVPTDSIPEFKLGDTAADIQWKKEESEARESVETKQQRKETRRKEARTEETHTQEEE